jgi:replicative DNA helicase
VRSGHLTVSCGSALVGAGGSSARPGDGVGGKGYVAAMSPSGVTLRLPVDRALDGFVGDLLDGVDRSAAIVPTGFVELDRVLSGGLRAGQLAVVGGEPGVGTSTLTLNIASHAAVRLGRPTVVVAPDSSRHELLARLTAAVAKVPVNHIRSGELSDGDREKLRRKRDDLARAPLHVSAGWPDATTPARVIADIEGWCDYELRLAVVDGTSVTEPHTRDLARDLKLLAQRAGIAVVLAMKTIAPSDRVGLPPRIDDLRAASEVTDLADLIILVHRDDVHDHTSLRPGEADLEVVKHRYGPTRSLVLAFQGHYARFVEETPNDGQSR